VDGEQFGRCEASPSTLAATQAAAAGEAEVMRSVTAAAAGPRAARGPAARP